MGLGRMEERSSEPSREIPSEGETIGGRYQIVRILGQGASGIVFEATHEFTGRAVALKWLHPHLAHDEIVVARFIREARAACAIDHPNVVAVLDAGRDRDTLFLVTEKLEGAPLSTSFLDAPLAADALVTALLPALRGVAAAHERGIIHRDLKPDNVFVVRSRPGWPGTTKVLDFGISKIHEATGRELTLSGAMLGSPYYMAPEQITDSKAIDERADVYALGVMLYEGLAGTVPYDADGLHELIAKVMGSNPFPIPATGLPPGLEDVVRRAMARSLEDRFPSVRELALALEPFAGARFEDADARRSRTSDPLRGTPSVEPLEGPPTQIGAAPPAPAPAPRTDPPPFGRVSLLDFPDIPTVPPRRAAASAPLAATVAPPEAPRASPAPRPHPLPGPAPLPSMTPDRSTLSIALVVAFGVVIFLAAFALGAVLF
jgi:serine/threonine-protein kinase